MDIGFLREFPRCLLAFYFSLGDKINLLFDLLLCGLPVMSVSLSVPQYIAS